MKIRAAGALVVLLVAACSSPEQPPVATPPVPSEAGPTIEPGGGNGGHDHKSHGGFGSGGGKRNGSSHDSGGAGGSSGASGSAGSGRSGDSSAGGSGSGPGGGRASSTQAAYPAAGGYVYSQRGSEAFCDPAGRSCDRHKLPRTQRIATSYGQRTQTEALVVTEVESGNGRYVRTTTHFTPDAAFVTEVYYRLVYGGLTLQERYEPDPPVPQIRFPLRPGNEWDATWKADTSGDYHARVTGTDTVSVGGTAVDTYRIETRTNFRGELDGKASVVMWFDARTRALVATTGALNLSASYGSYNTNFETTLKSAPGY